MNFYNNFKDRFTVYFPGVLVAILIAISAEFLSNNYEVPAMLMALLLGMIFYFLGEEGKCSEGLSFSSKSILRLGIILLGTRISADLVLSLDFEIIIIVTSGVLLTILFGIIILKAFGFDWKFGILVGGAVAICGASAAMAIASVLPKNEKSHQRLTFVIIGVTLLSTLAMIVYPILSSWLKMNNTNAGVFLGATIHDVAQVVGAGFSISNEAGETATLIKLYRVTLLFPIVLSVSVFVRYSNSGNRLTTKTPLIPMFVVLFISCATANSLGAIPEGMKNFFSELSKWCLLIAIASVGAKTKLKNLQLIGLTPAFLIIVTSIFLMVFVLVFI